MSCLPLNFFVAGKPEPKGSPRIIFAGGRRLLDVHTPKSRRWAAVVKAAARRAARGWTKPHHEVPLSVDLIFHLSRPKTVPPQRRHRQAATPDVDKLARCVLDALESAKVISNDSRVSRLLAEKYYGDLPGVVVTITEIRA